MLEQAILNPLCQFAWRLIPVLEKGLRYLESSPGYDPKATKNIMSMFCKLVDTIARIQKLSVTEMGRKKMPTAEEDMAILDDYYRRRRDQELQKEEEARRSTSNSEPAETGEHGHATQHHMDGTSPPET